MIMKLNGWMVAVVVDANATVRVLDGLDGCGWLPGDLLLVKCFSQVVVGLVGWCARSPKLAKLFPFNANFAWLLTFEGCCDSLECACAFVHRVRSVWIVRFRIQTPLPVA